MKVFFGFFFPTPQPPRLALPPHRMTHQYFQIFPEFWTVQPLPFLSGFQSLNHPVIVSRIILARRSTFYLSVPWCCCCRCCPRRQHFFGALFSGFFTLSRPDSSGSCFSSRFFFFFFLVSPRPCGLRFLLTDGGKGENPGGTMTAPALLSIPSATAPMSTRLFSFSRLFPISIIFSLVMLARNYLVLPFRCLLQKKNLSKTFPLLLLDIRSL